MARKFSAISQIEKIMLSSPNSAGLAKAPGNMSATISEGPALWPSVTPAYAARGSDGDSTAMASMVVRSVIVGV